MWDRRSLKGPITLGVILLILLVVLTVGWVLLSVSSALRDEGSAPLYWTALTVGSSFLGVVIIGVVTYLTLTVKAINLNRRQSNFVDSITHELKSPIASLKLYLQTLDRHAVSPEEQKRFFRYMLDDVERLDGLINHVLSAARMDRPFHDSDPEDVELAGVLERCVQEVCSHWRRPPETITLKIEPSVVRARRVDLELIFRNLLDNAMKYSGDPPEVLVTSHPRPDGTVLTQVIDNGPGIPVRSRAKIFLRFVRLGSELERSKPGTGLGLYIVQTLVQRWRGKVQVRDRRDARGTTFDVVLPGWTLESPSVPTAAHAVPARENG